MRSEAEYTEIAKRYPTIPAATLYSLYRYVQDRQPVGGFLGAVLENDLFAATSRADERNQLALVDIVKVVVNNCPADCQGSRQEVRNWLHPNPE